MKTAYIDSALWISRIEGIKTYQKIIDEAFQKLKSDGLSFCTSDVVLLEVIAKPYSNNNTPLVDIYNRIFSKIKLLKNYPNVFKNALTIAKSENLKSMDAIHVSIAVHHGCNCFVTSDTHFKNLKIITPVIVNLVKTTKA